MQPADALPTIAEIAITLAGFTGILLAVRSVAGTAGSSAQSRRIGFVLVGPAIVLLCSLLPFALSDFSKSPRIIWGVSLSIFGVTSLTMICTSAYRVLRGKMELTTPRASWAVMILGFVLALLALLSGMGQLYPYSPGILVLCLVWSLLSSAFSLISAVAVQVRSPGP